VTDTQSAGATPVVEGARPSQNQPASPATGIAPAAPSSATDASEQLGDAGKQALDRMKADKKASDDARKVAESERNALQARIEELENATRSDTEKAIATARKEAVAEVESRYQARIRASEVKSALTAAGMVDPEPVLGASQFTALKVTEDGVEGLDKAVEAFKTAHPRLFESSRPLGSADGGARGPAQPDVAPGLSRLRHAYETTKQ